MSPFLAFLIHSRKRDGSRVPLPGFGLCLAKLSSRTMIPLQKKSFGRSEKTPSFYYHGRSVRHDFGSPVSYVGSGKTEAHDRVGSQTSGLRQHAVQGLFSRLGDNLRIFSEFSANQILQEGEQVLPDVAGPHGVPFDNAEGFGDAAARHTFGGYDNHRLILSYLSDLERKNLSRRTETSRVQKPTMRVRTPMRITGCTFLSRKTSAITQ